MLSFRWRLQYVPGHHQQSTISNNTGYCNAGQYSTLGCHRGWKSPVLHCTRVHNFRHVPNAHLNSYPRIFQQRTLDPFWLGGHTVSVLH